MEATEPTIQQLFDLTGKVSLITGGTGYLGASMARALAEAGSTVVISSRDQARADAAAACLPHPEAKHWGLQMDHMDSQSIETAFKELIERTGQIDVLVNNGNEHCKHDWTDVQSEEFTRQLANATGYFELARHVHNHAVAQKRTASIILIGSMYGQVASYPDAYDGICMASPVAYHTLKGGLIHMTRHLAVYWAEDGVRVNCLSPGPFPGKQASEEMIKRLREKSPMKRMGLPHELKGALVYLASDAGSYTTGHNLTVDGGWTSW